MVLSIWREMTLLWYGHSVFIEKMVLNCTLKGNIWELEGKSILSTNVSLQRQKRHSNLDHELRVARCSLTGMRDIGRSNGDSEFGIIKDHVCRGLGPHPKELVTSSVLCLAKSCLTPCILETPNHSLLPHLPPTHTYTTRLVLAFRLQLPFPLFEISFPYSRAPLCQLVKLLLRS